LNSIVTRSYSQIKTCLWQDDEEILKHENCDFKISKSDDKIPDDEFPDTVYFVWIF